MIQTFRIDDVSMNTDLGSLWSIVDLLHRRCEGARVVVAVSPLVHRLDGEPLKDRERAFPRKLSAMSDHRNLFRVEHMGMPDFGSLDVKVASHGLVHVDHRLMGREAQELSIVTSCSLLGTQLFVPPFNKYDADTISICKEHEIELVRFEHGWQHVRYNDYSPKHHLYYMHTHDTNSTFLDVWLST